MIEYKPKEIWITDMTLRVPEKRNTIIIIMRDNNYKNVWMPSCLTDFLDRQHIDSEINTKLAAARPICSFLNYLNEQVELGEDERFSDLREKGLFGLNFYHLAGYITYISTKIERKNNRKTVNSKENFILDFYNFLQEKGITSTDRIQHKIAPVYVREYNGKLRKSKQGIMVIINPLKNKAKFIVKRPKNNNIPSTVLKDMNQDSWEILLEFAEEHYPQIALGVAFQCMGGLRLGEVVNLNIKSVELFPEKKHMMVDIKDRQKELFGDRRINQKKSQVKKERINQPIFDFNSELFNIWKTHLKMLASNPKVKNREALFIDSYGVFVK